MKRSPILKKDFPILQTFNLEDLNDGIQYKLESLLRELVDSKDIPLEQNDAVKLYYITHVWLFYAYKYHFNKPELPGLWQSYYPTHYNKIFDLFKNVWSKFFPKYLQKNDILFTWALFPNDHPAPIYYLLAAIVETAFKPTVEPVLTENSWEIKEIDNNCCYKDIVAREALIRSIPRSKKIIDVKNLKKLWDSTILFFEGTSTADLKNDESHGFLKLRKDWSTLFPNFLEDIDELVIAWAILSESPSPFICVLQASISKRLGIEFVIPDKYNHLKNNNFYSGNISSKIDSIKLFTNSGTSPSSGSSTSSSSSPISSLGSQFS